jgi:hypothetical protein
MAEYSYTYVPGKLKDFLGKIREIGVPANNTNGWSLLATSLAMTEAC